MTLTAALLHARDHAPLLLPLLRELELRRRGTADQYRLMKLGQRRRIFVEKLGEDSSLVINIDAEITTLRDSLVTLNGELRELLT